MSGLRKTSPRVQIVDTVRLDAWGLFSDAIERGIERGLVDSRRLVEDPDDETVKISVHEAIMTELADILVIDGR